MSKLELEFRKELIKVMAGLWLPTIHEENRYNPGVPDLSFVMNGDCETGWLELKQDESLRTDGYRFHVEPGQHRWMEAHAAKIPAYFLLDCGRTVILLNGTHHRLLSSPIGLPCLADNRARFFDRNEMRKGLYEALAQITKRTA